MKTDLFSTAIYNRYRLRFLYGLEEVFVDPYYIASDSTGRKVLYGKSSFSNEIKKFEYKKIVNIKIIDNKFSPVIPILN
jgi:hypothetical protein